MAEISAVDCNIMLGVTVKVNARSIMVLKAYIIGVFALQRDAFNMRSIKYYYFIAYRSTFIVDYFI